MKTIFVLFVLFITASLSPPVIAVNAANTHNDSMEPTTIDVMELDQQHIRTNINEHNIDDLYRRFEQHYGDFIGENPKRQVDYQFVMGKASSLKTFELLEWHQRAMEEGFNVERFNKFGIVVDKEWSYNIDYDLNPHLAEEGPFYSFLQTSRQMKKNFLLCRGFRETDIDIIQDYVAQNDIETMTEAKMMDYYEAILPELKTSFAYDKIYSEERLKQQLNAFSYGRKYIEYQLHRNWLIGLMNKLDNQRQRILKQFLADNIHGARAGGNIPNTLVSPVFIDMVNDGLYDREIAAYREEQLRKTQGEEQ